MQLTAVNSKCSPDIRPPLSSLAETLFFDRPAFNAPEELSRIVGAIYRQRRLGRKIVARVPGPEDALRLRLACDRIGIPGELGHPDRHSGADFTIIPGLANSGPGPAAASPQAGAAPLRIALAGYGVVGQALAERLEVEPGFEVVSILVRDTSRHRAIKPPCPLTDDTQAFLNVPADILVDALSCEETGFRLCSELLGSGIHAVSASKRVISQYREKLVTRAAAGGASLLYSASVGGAAPVLETVAAVRRKGGIRKVEAVLNGTVNYILTKLHEGLSFEEALCRARSAGFAEEDSSSDLSGADAAAKIKLIAAEAFGVDPASVKVDTQGLCAETAARIGASGQRWVQLSSLERMDGELRARVELALASAVTVPIVCDEWNCAIVTGEDGSVLRCTGRGAGGPATAEAIVADLFDISTLCTPAKEPPRAASCS